MYVFHTRSYHQTNMDEVLTRNTLAGLPQHRTGRRCRGESERREGSDWHGGKLHTQFQVRNSPLMEM